MSMLLSREAAKKSKYVKKTCIMDIFRVAKMYGLYGLLYGLFFFTLKLYGLYGLVFKLYGLYGFYPGKYTVFFKFSLISANFS